jgi:CRP/FNR family transcriptional regulator, cyclic AMP receptor protein
MLSTPEKVAILRSVSLFVDTPDKTLTHIAACLQQTEYQANQTIFEKNDPGDCMYIVVKGSVRVHDGERTLNSLGAGEVFGEMALLDFHPRVASATSTEASVLLRLDHDPFYVMMDEHPEISHGIIHTLCYRLRARVLDMNRDFEYMQQMARITSAAASLEAGTYDPRMLETVSLRSDELGQLARVFARMADEVRAREARLKQEVHELRIQIDEVKKAAQIEELTDNEFFRDLQKRSSMMRRSTKRKE